MDIKYLVDKYIDNDDSTKILKYNKNEIKVVDIEDSKESKRVARDAKNQKIITSAVLLAAAIIIIATAKSCGTKKEIIDNKQVVETNIDNTPKKEVDETPVEEVEETNEETTTQIKGKEIDYSNVETFYNQIVEARNTYGTFAESFQSEEDVKNLINFIYKFDSTYQFNDLTTTINNQEDFDVIIKDYYNSCVKYDVKPNLSILFKDGSLANKKMAQAEELAYDLKNGKGSDYTIANNYYTWFGKNICDGRTALDRNMKNAPLIDALREQYDAYRNVGNMLNARKYQKNDSLDIDGVEVYYAYEYPDGVEHVETQKSFTCPDWGIDNVVSKTEEVEETKLVKRIDNRALFTTIDEAFEFVCGSSRTR